MTNLCLFLHHGRNHFKRHGRVPDGIATILIGGGKIYTTTTRGAKNHDPQSGGGVYFSGPPGEGNSQNRQILSKIEPERAPEMMQKHRKSLPNGRQQGGAFGAAPRGRRFALPPWVFCCLPFGKDFLCFGLISGAHPEAFPPSFFLDSPPSLVFPDILGRPGP